MFSNHEKWFTLVEMIAFQNLIRRYKIFIFALILFLFGTGNVVATSPPDIGGPKIKYKVTGAKQVVFLIDYKYKDSQNSYLNDSYAADMEDMLEGTLPSYLSPDEVQLTYIAISETGKKSKPLTTTNNWKALPLVLFTQLIPYHFKIEE